MSCPSEAGDAEGARGGEVIWLTIDVSTLSPVPR